MQIWLDKNFLPFLNKQNRQHAQLGNRGYYATAMPPLGEIVSTHETIRHRSRGGEAVEPTTRTARTRPRIVARLLTIVILCSTFACSAQDIFSPKELTFQDGFGSRKGDRRIYVLTGGGWIRGIRYGDPDQFVTAWIAQHPLATITSVSKMPIKADELVYIWIEDQASSLNVDLVRAGIFPGGAMADMVDNDKGLTELLNNPKLADARALVEKERAENPRNSQRDWSPRMNTIDTWTRSRRRRLRRAKKSWEYGRTQ